MERMLLVVMAWVMFDGSASVWVGAAARWARSREIEVMQGADDIGHGLRQRHLRGAGARRRRAAADEWCRQHDASGPLKLPQGLEATGPLQLAVDIAEAEGHTRHRPARFGGRCRYVQAALEPARWHPAG